MDALRKIADAVLYEGYILWPYRRSAAKNRQRFTFGGVYPRAHSERHPDDSWVMQTEVLERGARSALSVRIRFLQVVQRQVLDEGVPVDSLEVGGERYLTWEEAVEREIEAAVPGRTAISVAAGSAIERLSKTASISRSWGALEGSVAVAVEEVQPELRRVTVRIENVSDFREGSRERALEQTFCSTHTVLTGGELVSLTDPPEDLREEAERCENAGTWPVLVGERGSRETMLSAAMILPDYPEVAPESPGDLFDGGEIDQLLVLNILSLTDEEKREVRATDPRAREILERTEGLSEEQLMRLHGTIREWGLAR